MTGTKNATVLLVFLATIGSGLYSRAKGQGSATLQTEKATLNSRQTGALSFEFFKTRVQPIFLKKRAEHARCYGCHILSNRIFRLEPLSPGSTDWSDEQSQRNFQSALEVVVPGDPASSKLLLHPLSLDAGGDPFHSG